MNELTLAIEEMIKRIVREEVALIPAPAPAPPPVEFVPSSVYTSDEFKGFVTRIVDEMTMNSFRRAAFDRNVKEALQDQPWFDDSITQNVVNCIDNRPPENISPNMFKTMYSSYVRDNPSHFREAITECFNNDWFKGQVREIMDDHVDFDQKVKDAIENMSVSISVD